MSRRESLRIAHDGAADRIKDVAAAAGVSITTVSHALNGKGRLPETTRQRVTDVAERLGYQPSALARGLAGGRTGLLALDGLVVDDLALAVGDFDYFMQRDERRDLGGARARLLPDAAADATRGGRCSTSSRSTARSSSTRSPATPIVDLLDKRGVPVVTTGRRPTADDDGYWVDNDHVAGTRAMLDHLAEQGAPRIALLTAPVLSSYTVDALAAFEATLRRARARVDRRDDRPNRSARAAPTRPPRSCSTRAEPPDAIYATLDRLALGALLAAEAKGDPRPRRTCASPAAPTATPADPPGPPSPRSASTRSRSAARRSTCW